MIKSDVNAHPILWRYIGVEFLARQPARHIKYPSACSPAGAGVRERYSFGVVCECRVQNPNVPLLNECVYTRLSI